MATKVRSITQRSAALCAAVLIGCTGVGVGGIVQAQVSDSPPATRVATQDKGSLSLVDTYGGLPVDRANGVLPIARLDGEHTVKIPDLYDQLYMNIYAEDAYNKLPVNKRSAYDALVVRATDAKAARMLRDTIMYHMYYGDSMDRLRVNGEIHEGWRMEGRREIAKALFDQATKGQHAKAWKDFSGNMPTGAASRSLCDTKGTRNAVVANIGAGERKYYSFSPTPYQVMFARADHVVLQSDAAPTPTENNRYCARQPQRAIMAGPDIDAGHIFADSLGGAGVIENMAPQSATFNRRGAQYQFEEQLRREARAHDVIALRYGAPYPDDGSMKLVHYQYCSVPKGKGAALSRNTGGFYVNDQFIDRVYDVGGSCVVASLYDREGSIFMSKSGRTLAQGRSSDTYTNMYGLKDFVPTGARLKGRLITPTHLFPGADRSLFGVEPSGTGKDGDVQRVTPSDKSSTTTTTGRAEPATTGRTTATTSTATTSSNITTGAAELTSQSTARRSTSTHVVDPTITSTGRGSSGVADTTRATTRATTTNATTSTRQEPTVTTRSTTSSTIASTTTTTTRTPWYDKYAPSTTATPTRSMTFNYQRDQWSSLEREVDRARANKRASDHGGVTVIPTLPREMERATERDTVPSSERAQGTAKNTAKNTAKSTVQSTGSNSTATNTASSVTPSTTQQPQNQGELAVTGSSTRTLLCMLGVAVSAVLALLIAFGLRKHHE